MFILSHSTSIWQGWRSFSTQRQYIRFLILKSHKPFLRQWRSHTRHPIMTMCSSENALQNCDKTESLSKHNSGDFSEISIDKTKFDVSYQLLAIRVPKQHSGAVSKLLSRYVFNKPRVRHIVPDPSNSDLRLVILSENITDPNLSELPQDKLSSVKSLTEVEVVPHEVVLGYDYWPADHILKGLLPAGCEVQSSFETIGHIAHLNIRDDVLPYKNLIAAVILEKNQPKIRTIVNKVGTISNEFRVPTFEVLAGEQSLVTEVKQHGAIFRLDYGLVYWNSRLEHEHIRLVSQFHPNDVICDMFAGIGPFVIPAAQKGCIVYANDLNPDSIKYLNINVGTNKVKNRVHVYNMDAREFVRKIVLPEEGSLKEEPLRDPSLPHEGFVNQGDDGSVKDASSPYDESTKEKTQSNGTQMKNKKQLIDEVHGRPWEHIDHVVMNLPASALEFLDAFNGLLSRKRWKGTMPRVHCYCFMRANETTEDVVKRAENTMKGTIQKPEIWEVRDVAPNKRMLCLSFDLPEEVAFREVYVEGTESVSNIEANIKRQRLES